MKNQCPKCKSEHVDTINMLGTRFLICLDCGYDETEDLEVYAGGRKSKGGKSSPYKRGGSMRTVKR